MFSAVLLLGVLAAACGGGGGSGPDLVDSGVQRIRDRTLGISLDAPGTWTVDYKTDRLVVQSGDEDGIVLTLFALDEPFSERGFRETVFQVSGAFASPEAVPVQPQRLGERAVLSAEYAARDVSLSRDFQVRQFATTELPAFTILARWLADTPSETALQVDRVLRSIRLSMPATSPGVWERISAPTEAALFAAAFLDDETGFISGQAGTLLRTDDGGNRWTAIDSGVDGSLFAITFDRAGRVGLIAGSDGVVLRTEDSGMTWKRILSGTDRFLTGVALHPDGEVAVAVGGFGTARRSVDGGRSWADLGLDTEETFNAVDVSPDGRLFQAVGRRVHAESADLGLSWRVGPFDQTLLAIDVVNDGFAVATGDLGAVWRTDTGGFAWGFIANFEAPIIEGVAVDALRHVLVVGSVGLIAYSEDALSFQSEVSGVDVQLRGAAVRQDGSRFVVGDEGVILRSVPQ